MAYGLRIRDASGNITFDVTDRVTHYLYEWITTTDTSEIKTIPGMEYETDIAVIICKREATFGRYGWEKISPTEIEISYYEAPGCSVPGSSAQIYVLGY